MSKIKLFLFCAYIVLIIQCIRSLMVSKSHEDTIELQYLIKKPTGMRIMDRKIKKGQVQRGYKNFSVVTNIPERLPTDIKYILLYTDAFAHKSTYVKKGQDEFINANCKFINCYITSDKGMLFGVQYFDAILFDVENYWDGYPSVRSPHQKYVFVALESAQDNPICNKMFDDFYNLTWTYKLDSDVTWPYMIVYDKSDAVVGPKINMTWQNPLGPIPKQVKKKLEKKRKVAAWFVSNCNTKSNRVDLFEHLQLEFRKYNMSIDMFGLCGKKQCVKDRMADCLELVERDYYFYLAFENAMCEDYVTEKVLHALLHYAVPIVYGGANYTRFLPPGSFINADDESPESIVALVIDAMQNRNRYEDYFRYEEKENRIEVISSEEFRQFEKQKKEVKKHKRMIQINKTKRYEAKAKQDKKIQKKKAEKHKIEEEE